jgi:hypothetical protein
VARFNGHDDYEDALHEIWSVMYGVQEREELNEQSKSLAGVQRVRGRRR